MQKDTRLYSISDICDVTGQNEALAAHLSFTTNPVLSNFIAKNNFLYCTILQLSAKLFWRRLFSEKETNLGLNYYRTQLKFKKFF